MADDVVAWRKFGREDGRDLEVILDKIICGPGSGSDDSGLRDL